MSDYGLYQNCLGKGTVDTQQPLCNPMDFY